MKLDLGQDRWMPIPGTVSEAEAKEVRCGVCGATMNYMPNQYGATTWAGSMAGVKRAYDLFICPNHDLGWHNHVQKLQELQRATPSSKLAGIYEGDANAILKENCK